MAAPAAMGTAQWSTEICSMGDCPCCKPMGLCCWSCCCAGFAYANNARMLERGKPIESCDFQCGDYDADYCKRFWMVECCQLIIINLEYLPYGIGQSIWPIFAHLQACYTRGVRVKTAEKYGIDTTVVHEGKCCHIGQDCIVCKPQACAMCGCDTAEQSVAHDSHCCCFCCAIIQEHKTHHDMIAKGYTAPAQMNMGRT